MKNFEEYQHYKDGRKRNPEKKKKKPGWENPKRKQEYQKSVTCLTTAKSRDKFGKERLAN